MNCPLYPSNGTRRASTTRTCRSPNTISSTQLPTGLPPPQDLMLLQPLSSNYPHTPLTSGTPKTPNSTTTVRHYQQTSPQSSIHSMAQTSYSGSAPMMPPTTTAASHPQPMALAPDAGRGLSVLHPTPGGIMAQLNNSSPYSSGSLIQPNPLLFDGDQPTHVVGSQGRRGILPSAPGRPAIQTAATGPKSTVKPIKDADGKYPCSHCPKSYLHAKHLKRHLLRHTGDRPYMCVLCHDTFSRSDILKRHFQKCSIRRGNPTGVSHLSHRQARVQNHELAQKAGGPGNAGDTKFANELNNMPSHGVVHPFSMASFYDGMNNKAGEQNYPSRSASSNQDHNDSAPTMGAPQPYGQMFLTP